MSEERRITIDVPNPALQVRTSVYEECKRKYPQTVAEFERIQAAQVQQFCKKMMNYGTGNISVGTNCQTDEEIHLSHTGLWFRLNDKIQRLKQLIIYNEQDHVGEPREDAFDDLSIYGIIAQIVSNRKWGK